MTNAQTADSLAVAPEILTAPELARELRIDPVTLRRWLTQGLVCGVKIGREWRIERTEADRVRRYGVRRAAPVQATA